MEDIQSPTSIHSSRPWPLTVFGIVGIVIAVLASAAIIWMFGTGQIIITFSLIAPFAGLFIALGLRFAAGVGMLLMRKWVYPVFITIVILSALSVASAFLSDLAIGLAVVTFLVELGILWYLWRHKALLK